MRFPVLHLPLALLSGMSAQMTAQEAVPEAKIELVQVDVVVTDARGKPVRDLTQQDFVVLEDSKPQRLSHFALAGRDAPRVSAQAAAGAAAPSAALPGRKIVLIVDDLHIASGNLAFTKQALKQLVAEFLASDDDVGLVTVSSSAVTQQPTRDRALLEQAVDRLSVREVAIAPARGSQMTPAQAELILRGDPSALQLAARTLMAEEPGGAVPPNSPQAAVDQPAGLQATGREGMAQLMGSGNTSVPEKEARRQARAVLADSLRFSGATLAVVEEVLRSLRLFPGRKVCLLVSDGFLVGLGTDDERTKDMQRVLDAATRSGAVLYALDTRGLTGSGGDAAVAGSSVPVGLQDRVSRMTQQIFRETLDTLAEGTGGFLVRGTNDLAGGLRRMLEDAGSYYLLAYEPANPKRDGRFRKLEVRLPSRADLVVRTRKGYFAPDDRKRPASKPEIPPVPRELDEAEARAALAAVVPADGMPVQLVADYVDLPPSGPQAVVRARVDVAGLHWQKAGGRQQASVELLAGVYDAQGKPVGAPFGRRADLDLSAAEQKKAADAGLQYQQQVALPPGRYQIRFVAREQKGTAFGGASQWIDIPDLAAKTLTLSSVFLSSSAPVSAIGGPGAAGGERLQDAQALRRFKKGEDVYFQLYVYNVSRDEKGANDVVLQAQIRSGTSVIAASKPQPVALQQKDGIPLPETNGMSLEGLAPGSYELRIVVVDRKTNVTINRSVDFSVE